VQQKKALQTHHGDWNKSKLVDQSKTNDKYNWQYLHARHGTIQKCRQSLCESQWSYLWHPSDSIAESRVCPVSTDHLMCMDTACPLASSYTPNSVHEQFVAAQLSLKVCKQLQTELLHKSSWWAEYVPHQFHKYLSHFYTVYNGHMLVSSPILLLT